MKILLLAAGCIMLAGCAGAGRIAENPASVGNVETVAETEPAGSVAALPEPVSFAPTYQAAPEKQYAEARRIYDSSPAAAQGDQVSGRDRHAACNRSASGEVSPTSAAVPAEKPGGGKRIGRRHRDLPICSGLPFDRYRKGNREKSR